MRASGKSPDHSVFPSVLKACAHLTTLNLGKQLHGYIIRSGFDGNVFIASSLVDMYAKCGHIRIAEWVFNGVKSHDMVSWTAMMMGCALHSNAQDAISLFARMESEGLRPNYVAFTAILTACSHAGLIDEGQRYFDSMIQKYGIEPGMEHYAAMADLLSRKGRLDEALNFIQKMPINPDLVIWGGLFCACRAHKNVEMAELSARKLLELEPKHPGSYVFLSNAYAAVGRWEDAERVRNLMLDKGVGKEPGWSYIELDGRLHRFVAGDNARKDAKEIQVKLEEILSGARQQGYTPGTEWVLHNIEEEEKEDALGSHSEKLALAFALIQTSPKTTIRIVKNLRICGDCHSLMKYTSAMSQREIIVRDIKRFHHFKDGTCSCGDYW
ncbi:Putative pentatricopeptide repeat-containing protein At3g23330 [Linum perenne]